MKSTNTATVKEEILHCAVRLFAERGWERTTLQDVADCLGITRGPIYYYYRGKQELYDAALIYRMERFVQRTEAILTQDADIFTRLEQLLADWLGRRIADYYVRDVISIPALQNSRRHYTLAVEKAYDFMRRRLGEEVEQGTLKPGTDPAGIVESVLICSNGLIAMVQSPVRSCCKEDPHTAIRNYVGMLRQRYGAQPV